MKTNLSALSSSMTNLSAANAINGLRDIKPPMAITNGWEWLWWVLGGLAVAGLLYWAWRYWQRRRRQVPPAIIVPPHERARRKLQEALDFIEQPRPFCILVSDAVRLYLEEAFAMRAPERTTEEFLAELQTSKLLTLSQKQLLGDFLMRCDLVKFARHEPSVDQLQELYRSALKLIDETQPHPTANPTGSAPPAPPRGETPMDIANQSSKLVDSKKETADRS